MSISTVQYVRCPDQFSFALVELQPPGREPSPIWCSQVCLGRSGCLQPNEGGYLGTANIGTLKGIYSRDIYRLVTKTWLLSVQITLIPRLYLGPRIFAEAGFHAESDFNLMFYRILSSGRIQPQ